MEPQDYLKRLERLKDNRTNFDTQWQEVKDVVWPDAGDFITKRSPGEKTTRRIYEMTAALALEKFASAMESFLVPRHLRWHGLMASDDTVQKDPQVQEWMENATRTLFKNRERPQARFYGQFNEGLKSLGAFGNECVFTNDDSSGRGVNYRSEERL